MSAALKYNVRKDGQRTSAYNDDEQSTLDTLEHLSEKLIALAEEETQSLKQGDISRFSLLQKDKKILAQTYKDASRDFANNIENFQNADTAKLTQIERMQRTLKQRAKTNNELIQGIALKNTQSTGSTLFAVQEMAQSGHYNT